MSKVSFPLSFLAAFAVSLSIIAHLSGYDRLGGSVLVVLAMLTFGLAFVFRRVWATQEVPASLRTLVPTVVVCLVAAAVLYHVLPIRADVFPRGADLRVLAIGSAGHDAKASEVWAKVILPDGAVVKPKVVPSCWKLNDDGGVVASAITEQPVEWRIPLEAGAQLRLVKHPWSGRARVQWLGQEEDVSLYSDRDQSHTVGLEGRQPTRLKDRIAAWAISIADVLTLTMLFLIIGKLAWAVLWRNE